MRTLAFTACLLLVAGSAGTGAARAQAQEGVRTAPLRVASVPVRVDGRIDGDEWAGARVESGFVQQQPDAGAAATLATDVRILRDDAAVYVAARMHDPHPDSIVARLARRDASVTSDWFWVYFDTFRDRRNAFGFGVNAAGVKRDVRIADDTREDAGWDAVWEAVVRTDSEGWVAELRIPLSQLRYRAGASDVTWGVNLRRLIARRDETSTWSPSPQGGSRFVSDFGDLRVEGVLPARSDLEVRPFVVTSAERAPGPAADPFRGSLNTSISAGADVVLGIGGGLTLSATANPDFGQVEADPSEMNLSAFETFLSERRPFFVEGAEVFQLTSPSVPRLFHSRRIGRAVQGGPPGDALFVEPAGNARILGAAKVTGTTQDGWTIGVLDAVTAEESAAFVTDDGSPGSAVVEPLTNFAVVRAARAFHEQRASVGGMVTATHRDIGNASLRMLHTSAWSGALDARYRTSGGRLQLAGSVMGSHVRGDTLALQRTQRAAGRRFDRPDADHVSYDPAATSLTGVGANLRINTLGATPWRFTAEGWARTPGLEIGDLGFQFADGADAIGGWSNLSWRRLQPTGPFRTFGIGLDSYFNMTFGGEVWERGGGLSVHGQLANLWTFFVNAGGNLPALSPEALRGGPALYRAANTGVYAELGTDPRRAVVLSATANLRRASDTDVPSSFLQPQLTIRPSSRTSVSLSATVQRRREAAQFVGRVAGDTGPDWIVAAMDQRIHSATLRADHTFGPDLSLQLWLQPFLAAAHYTSFRAVADPRDRDRERRFDPVPADDARFQSPDFSMRELRANVVLRWEYRPGSTAWLVWGHDRARSGPGAEFDLGRAWDDLHDAKPANRLMLKLAYRLGS